MRLSLPHIGALVALMAGWAAAGPGASRAQTDVVYTFANAALAPDGANWSVDIQVAATAGGTRLGDALFYLEYDPSDFGTNVVAAGRVQVVAEGPATPASRYAVHLNDNADARLAVALEYLDAATPANGSVLTTTPVTALRVTMDVAGADPPGAVAGVRFHEALMAGQQYQSDPALTFAQIRASASSTVSLSGAAPDWEVNPASFQSTVTLVGAVTLGSGPLNGANDVLAAFSGSEVRGVANTVDVGGTRLFFLTIYANGDGETITFKAWNAAQAEVATLSETITFTANASHGSISAPFTFTEAAGAQSINLARGWNLISLTVEPDDPAPANVFADAAAELEFVTGFNNGATFFDPNGLSFLNTLTSLEGGRGYWVKVTSAVAVTVAGTPLPDGFTLPLQPGWNLIGYWRSAARGPSELFASQIAANRLQFVTGFAGGATFFNPAGLSFLNTLATLQRGRGYWVRVNQGIPDFTFDAAPAAERHDGAPGSDIALRAGVDPGAEVAVNVAPRGVVPTNRFMFVGGKLLEDGPESGVAGDASGTDVLVVTGSGRRVGAGTVLSSGDMPAIAVYGDDPTTEAIDGALDGEELFLEFGGTTVPTGLRFEADMALREPLLSPVDRTEILLAAQDRPQVEQNLPVAFALDPGYPNPFTTRMTLPLALPEAAAVRAELYTLQGRFVGVVADGEWPGGRHTLTVEPARFAALGGGGPLASGLYILVFEARPAGGRPWRATQTIHVIR